ncbi:MAG TPA: M1 family aminopeptidase [Thermoanaerobaculia bacterium]|nr:M1 family aminopeptidase [Thermoanaerobaculia bacterium]
MRLCLAAITLAAFPLLALDPANARAEYDHLQKWQFAVATPLTAPVTITRDTATWTLISGSVRLIEPLADGTVTGLMFEGQGTFRMTMPDKYELAQLRRFARRPQLEALEQTFTQLVLRTSDGSVARLFGAATLPYSTDSIATKRHEAWLVETFEDPDARIIAALLNPGAEQFIADMHTPDFDWLRYDYDSSRAEEIAVMRADARGAEVWGSFDRADERIAGGRPSPGAFRVALEHIDVKADLTNLSHAVGLSRQRGLEGKYVVEETFVGVGDVTHVLTLGLIPTAKKLEAFDASGAPLTIFRDAIGKRSVHIDNKLHDDELFVILSQPLKRGEKQRVRFQYELETANYAPGRSWYPTLPEGFEQKHTARLELTVRRKNELRAMGRMESKREDGGNETSVWIVDRPARMITFSTATRFEEVTVSPGGIPPVTAFGPDYQFSNTAKLRNVAADVANSMQYFQNLLGSPVASEQFYVTSIAAGHGQAFDGFLHMTEWTFHSESSGASELFRAHEVAHAWWGHKVGWKTYRDQWISEAFAEYCAMMFVHDVVKGGDRHFDEMLRSYEGIVKGNLLAGGFSKFNRPWLVERNPADRARLGPIGHGYRAATVEIPTGYLIQTYFKGPLVLHMLRSLMKMRLGSDDAFVRTLRDFIAEYEGKSASTEDFRRILERTVSSDFGWFFDSWIYRAEIPSYTWKYSVQPEESQYAVTIDLQRRDVADDFVAVIPVRIEMDGGKTAVVFISNKQNRQTVTYKVPAKPKNVVFAPDSSLLAYVKRN